jgi:hypothetical protein
LAVGFFVLIPLPRLPLFCACELITKPIGEFLVRDGVIECKAFGLTDENKTQKHQDTTGIWETFVQPEAHTTSDRNSSACTDNRSLSRTVPILDTIGTMVAYTKRIGLEGAMGW